jgi:uncharacterized membrane protein YfcA
MENIYREFAFMTASYGFGMLFIGIIGLFVGARVAHYIINKNIEKDKDDTTSN